MGLDAASLDRMLRDRTPLAEVEAVGRAAAPDQRSVLGVLQPWLDAHPADDAALAIVFGVLLGISRATPLVWNHGFYWGLIARAGRSPAGSDGVCVLGQVLALPDNAYAQANIRRWYRGIYERNEHAAMTAEARAAIAASGVAWELAPLGSLADAWAVMLALATTESHAASPAAGCPHVWEHVEGGVALAGDTLLAQFIAANPRVLERAVLERIGELARMPGSAGKPVLSQLLETGFEHPAAWARTHAAWDPELGLRLFEQAQRERLLDATTEHNSFHVATAWSRRAPEQVAGLSPEMRDVLRALADRTPLPLPLILPEDVGGHTPDQIEAELARYAGVTVEQLYRRMTGDGTFISKYIAAGERLGELIARDAATLRALGVSRIALADRLLAVLAATPCDDGWHAVSPVEARAIAFMGHAHDPFHVYDVYDLHGHLGSKDFAIRRGELELHGGDLQVALIRRACFFGGPGCYRIDPELAVRVLLE